MNNFVPILAAVIGSGLAIVGQYLSRQRTQRIDDLAEALHKLPEGPSRTQIEQAIQYEASKLKTRDTAPNFATSLLTISAIGLGGVSLTYLGSYLDGSNEPQWDAIIAQVLTVLGLGLIVISGLILILLIIVFSFRAGRRLAKKTNANRKRHIEKMQEGPSGDTAGQVPDEEVH